MSQMAEVRASIECAQHQKLCVVLNIQEILSRIVLIVLLVFWFMIMYGQAVDTVHLQFSVWLPRNLRKEEKN